MAVSGLAPLPDSLKSGVQKYMKIAVEHDKRDPVVAYYCRLYAMQQGMLIDKSTPDARKFLVSLMDYLEKTKSEMSEEEALHNEVIGQAHMENYALKLFLYADNEDRGGRFGKNVIKAFLTSSLLMDVLSTFGELSEDIEKNRKYAKWKALYINKCLQNGETPMAGPLPEEGGDGAEFNDPSGIGFENVSGPSNPPSHMTFSNESGLYPAPGAHAPPSTPQDPPRSDNQPPSSIQSSPKPGGRSLPTPQPRNQLPQAPGAASFPATDWTPPANPSGAQLTAEQYQRGIKYCKYASSAMQYEDSATAIANLTKALKLLTTGVDEK